MYQCPRCDYTFDRPFWSTYRGELHKAFCPSCGHDMSPGPWGALLKLAGVILIGGLVTVAANRFDPPPTDQVTVAADVANVRAGPGTDGRVIRTVHRGERLRRVGEANGWTQVDVEGARGYVYSGLLRAGSPPRR